MLDRCLVLDIMHAQGKASTPHAELVEAVLKNVASAHCQPEAAVPPVVIATGMYAIPEVGALVVKLNQARHLQQGLQ